jgi:hypothetical protein
MSGPLRRNKRSRPAEAGEPLQEGLAAEPESAAPTADTPPAAPAGGDEPTTEPLPAGVPGEPDGEGETPRAEAAAHQPPAEETTAELSGPGESSGAKTPDASPAAESSGAKTPDASATAESGSPASPEEVTPAEGTAPAGKTRRRRWRPFRREGKRAPATEPTAPAPPAPVLLADPNTPAGIDPAEAPFRPPAGRRGRLRRRLRYLRRARELMLRDLGGLLYEVHRTGGGRIEAHATVVGAKVQRIAGLDAEAHALETALAAPRSETVVFEPGVGGTCATCGELYGSDARFCSNCGAPVGTDAPVAPQADPKPAEEAVAPARRAFWRRAVRSEPATAETSEQTAVTAPGETPHGAGDETSGSPGDETSKRAADDVPNRTADEPAKGAAGETPKGTADETQAATTDETAGNEPRNPTSGLRNGRPEDHPPPGLSSGDPLVSREWRT